MANALVKHAFVSAVAEGTDATKVRTSNWNAAELFSGGAEGEVIVSRAASATGAAWEAPVTLRTLFTNVTPASTTGTIEETLMSYPLPAATLAVNGRGVRITTFGAFAASTNSKTIKVYFGATSMVSIATVSAGVTSWRAFVEVFRTAAATQIVGGFGMAGNTGAGSVGSQLVASTPAETLSGTVLIKVTGTTPTTIADATALAFMVEAI